MPNLFGYRQIVRLYCFEQISMVLDTSVKGQTEIEDCEGLLQSDLGATAV